MVNQYVSGKRGPGSFPAPVCDLTDGYPLWQWYEVACWLWQKGIVGEAVLRASQDIAVINRVLELIHLRELDPSLAEEVFRDVGETPSASPAWFIEIDWLGGTAGMSYFHELRDFERRFDTMSVDELKRWEAYWTRHAQGLAPKVRKQAMKRVYEIEKAIQQRSQEDGDGE